MVIKMCSTNVQSIKNRFEQQIINEKTKAEKYILKRSATSLEPFTINRNHSTNNLPLNESAQRRVPNFQRSKTSLDLLNNNKSDLKSNYDLNYENSSNKNNTRPTTESYIDTSKGQPLLTRQLSDPVKRGNIKRSPAFRCEKSFESNVMPCQKSSNDSRLNFSNKIRMFEQCQSKNKTPMCTNVSKPSNEYRSSRYPIKSSRISDTDTDKINNLKNNKQFEISKTKQAMSASPTKFKTNQLLREELNMIVDRQRQLTKEKQLDLNSDTPPSSSTSNSRSNSSSPLPHPVIPEYSLVIKPKTNLSKINQNMITTDDDCSDLLAQQLSLESNDNLTDTLKKVLKSPLPEGPPPKKPPRTFIHPVKSYNNSSDVNNSSQRDNLRQFDDRLLNNCKGLEKVNTLKKTGKCRNDPRLMLDKLENALLQNKIKSPRTRRKVLDVENIKLNNAKGIMTGPTKANNLLIMDKNKSVKLNEIDQKNKLFNDCFPICVNNQYAKPLQPKSEFFVDNNLSDGSSRRIEHIYAEPFQFQKDVPDLFKNKTELCNNSHNARLSTTFERNMERNTSSNNGLHYLCTPISPTSVTLTSSNLVNKLNTDVDAKTAAYGCYNNVDRRNSNVTAEEIVSNNNNKKLNCDKIDTADQISRISCVNNHNSLTDSDFESTLSTPSPSCEEQFNVLSSLLTVENQISVHNNLYHMLSKNSSKMSTTPSPVNESKKKSDIENTTQTSSPGRVRFLVEQLEHNNIDIQNSSNNHAYSEKFDNRKVKSNNLNKNIDKTSQNAEVSQVQNSQFLDHLSKLLATDTEEETFEWVEQKDVFTQSLPLESDHYNVERQKRSDDFCSRSLSIKHKMYVRRVASKVKYARMVSQTDCSPHLFDCCLLIGLNTLTKVPYIKNKYPQNKNTPPWIESLCFPDAAHWNSSLNSKEHGGVYSLILTNENGDRHFGFCRRVLPEEESEFLPLVYCILTPFRAVGFYNQILEEIESRHGLPEFIQHSFLRELYNTPFPKPGNTVRVKCLKPQSDVSYQCDDNKTKTDFNSQKSLPDSGNFSDVTDEFLLINCKDKELISNISDRNTLNTSRKLTRSSSSPLLSDEFQQTSMSSNLTYCEVSFTRPLDTRTSEIDLAVLLDTLNIPIILKIFGSLLLERKVVFVCLTLSKLSICMDALQSMLYPFSWQHTLIPVLPSVLIDVLSAPTPFIIGVLSSAYKDVNTIEDGIVIDLDTLTVLDSVGDENSILPPRITRYLKAALNSDQIKNAENLNTKNVLISEAFIGAFLHLCGNYKQFMLKQEKKFEKEAFIKSNTSKNLQLFLEWFTETAMFNAFIDSQLYPSNTSKICSCINEDLFQTRLNTFLERLSKKKTFSEKLKNWTNFS